MVVLQVSTSSAVYIFRLQALQAHGRMKDPADVLHLLQPLLAAPDVFKCGVGHAQAQQTLQQLGGRQQQLRCEPPWATAFWATAQLPFASMEVSGICR